MKDKDKVKEKTAPRFKVLCFGGRGGRPVPLSLKSGSAMALVVWRGPVLTRATPVLVLRALCEAQ